MALKKIGFLCVGLKGWISLERTKKFYVDSLKLTHEIVLIHSEEEFLEKLDSFDIIINFFGNLVWEHKSKIKTSVVFCLHGGAVLNYKFLINNAEKINENDSFIVNCTSDIAILEEIFKTKPKTHLLKLPISEDLVLNFAKPDCKSVLSINENTLVLGYVARILPQKNLHHAIHILNKVKKEITKDVKLIIVGDYWVDYPVLNWQKEENEYHTYINELIDTYQLSENTLQFQSNLSNEELALCYGALDFLIHPTNSLDENFGYAPIEAMKCGTPVIGAAYGGLKDSILHEETGFLLNTWSSEAGIRAEYYDALAYIKKLYTNPSLKEEVTNNCLVRAQETYSFESCACDLMDIIGEALKSQIATNTMVGNLDSLLYEENEYLPKVKPSWNYYKKVAQIYCNTTIENVKFSDKLLLRTFSKFNIQEQQIVFQDPTWPAKIPYNTETKEILDICINGTNYNQLKTKLSFNIDNETLLHLISIGALLFSKQQKV